MTEPEKDQFNIRLSAIESKLDDIAKKATHPESAPKTIAMIGTLKDMFKEHIQKSDSLIDIHFKEDAVFQQKTVDFQKKTSEAMHQLNEIVPIIKEQLLPAYNREVNAENAKKYLFERFTTWGGLAKTASTIGVFLLGILFIIKTFLKP